MREIKFVANPTQQAFIESRAEADLFASRMGEGKSAALCWAVFYHTRHNPGADWLLIRDTWLNMQATTQKEFFHWFAPGVFGDYVSSKKTFTWRPGTGLTGSVQFIGLEDPDDASKLQSRNFAGFGIDEPAPAAATGGVAEMIFDIALSRLRQPGMNWYAVKLAENNPDESHWTYRRFVSPGSPGFVYHQTRQPENDHNLPPGYYDRLSRQWEHRPDLHRRFVEGKTGFQQVGDQVTPEWSDELHLASRLSPVANVDLQLLWDGGLNSTCLITQVTPSGDWLVLEAHVGENAGAYEMIQDVVKPRLASAYAGYRWRHIGDPSLGNREQSRAGTSASQLIVKELGGPFLPGPISEPARVEPLRAVLRKVREGRGIVRVDRERAAPVWHALRGGWHRRIGRTGAVGEIVKNIHSHPADALGYGAACLFPHGTLRPRGENYTPVRAAGYFHAGPNGLGFERPGFRLPKAGSAPARGGG